MVTFDQERGLERWYSYRGDEDYWIRFYGRLGIPCARWRDYEAWGHRFFPPPPDDVIRGKVTLRPKRRRTNYRTWQAPY